MPEINIRIASENDFFVLKKILNDTKTDWSADILTDCFSTDYFLWMIGDSRQAMGFVVVRNNREYWEIMQIVIDNKFQRREWAKKLLQYVVSEAKKKQIKKLQLEVRVSNIAAITLYEKAGFQRVGLRKKYYANHEDAVLMDLGI